MKIVSSINRINDIKYKLIKFKYILKVLKYTEILGTIINKSKKKIIIKILSASTELIGWESVVVRRFGDQFL